MSEGDDLVLQSYSGVDSEQSSFNDTTSEEDAHIVVCHICSIYKCMVKAIHVFTKYTTVVKSQPHVYKF